MKIHYIFLFLFGFNICLKLDEAKAKNNLKDKNTEIVMGYYSLVLKWQKKGNYAQAEKAYNKVISLLPNDTEIRANYASFLLEADKPEKALAEINSVLQLSPNNARLRVLAGQIYFKLNKFEESAQEYKIALSLEPTYTLINYYLAQSLQSAELYAQSIEPLEKALAENQNSIKILFALAIAEHKTNKLNSAISHYQQILSLYPNYELAQSNLAKAYYDIGNLGQAEINYLQLAQIYPGRLDLWTSLANIKFKQNLLNEAINYAKKALILEPNDSSLNALIASYYEKKQDLNQALNYYQSAYDLENNTDWKNKYLLNKAQILYKKGDYEPAESIISKLLIQKPNDFQLKSQLADIKLWQKKYAEASSLYREALNLNPSFNKQKLFLFNYATSLSGQKDWQNAENIWNIYTKIDPNNKLALFNWGVALEEQNKNNEAINAYRKSINAGYTKQIALNEIVNLQIELNDWKNAEASLKELINLNSHKTKYQLILAKVLVKQNRKEEAIKVLKEAGEEDSAIELELDLADRIAKAGDYYTASSEYQKILNESPNNFNAIMGLADSYAGIGQYDRAGNLYVKALSLQSNNFQAQFNYAGTLANLQKDEQAIEAYKKAINLNPNYAETYYALGLILFDKDLNLAKTYWKKYLEISPNGEYKSNILSKIPNL